MAFVGRTEVDASSEEVDSVESEEEHDTTLSFAKMRTLHGMVDENADGKVSMSEMMAFAGNTRHLMAARDIHSIMEELDADKDGKASLKEVLRDYESLDSEDDAIQDTQNRKKLEESKFKLADKNGDGSLDATELPSLFYPETHDEILELTAKSAVLLKDSDGDGVLSLKEFWEWDKEGPEEEAGSESMLQEQDYFSKLDKDGDGKLDFKEFMPWESGAFHTEEAMRQFFELVDTDKDGHVSTEEFLAAEATGGLPSTDAYFQFMEWAHHHEL